VYERQHSRLGEAQSPLPEITITLDRLKKRGYESMLELYQRIAPLRNFGKLSKTERGSRHQLNAGETAYSD
jgi:hypothetical protein